MRYLKNLRSSNAEKFHFGISSVRPPFADKATYREWCGDNSTNHVFYSLAEGSTPSERVSTHNPVHLVHGVVADYDAPVEWAALDLILRTSCTVEPTWISRTFSDYVRLVWVFESPIPIDPSMYDAFMVEMAKALKLNRLLAGFDDSCLRPTQYFELGEDWREFGYVTPSSIVQMALIKAASAAPPAEAVEIPIERVAAKVEAMFPNRWPGDFVVGARGPLFWVEDGVDRVGCQVVPEGVICYSDRAHKGFLSWAELFGPEFVQEFEQEKLGGILDEYWFNGKAFFKLLFGNAVVVPKDQVILELRRAGYSAKTKKGQALSEVEAALLTICNQNRVDEIAPVVFSKERVVEYNGARILNSSTVRPTEPAASGDPTFWPFLHSWLNQLFCPTPDRPATDYLFGWLQRFYRAVYERQFLQGHALLLVGPTNKGKSLLSNKVISGLVGGFADASDYLSGQTKFNRDLARVPTWVIDDTTSAASFQDQRKATELIKRAVANPRIEYHAKYVDAVSLPWTGRVVFSLNMDANSVSVLPALDSSNRDKLMALRIAEDAMSKFPANSVVEGIIRKELPYFARWLLDWQMPSELEDYSRFGIVSYIDDCIASAAYDNSSRSAIAELVEFFSARFRSFNEEKKIWEGTLTDFQVLLHELNNGRSVGMSHNLEFVRRGMVTMEEAYKANKALRPVTSRGHGGGKIWRIDLHKDYDIINTFE